MMCVVRVLLAGGIVVKLLRIFVYIYRDFGLMLFVM
jgi:hypothetical protein